MVRVLLENVTKVFDSEVTAVNDATLEVDDQEFMVIVGPSGCGKTTILRMIAGLEEPSSGTITIGDRIVNDIPPNDRDITMVFQNYALYPHMTVFDNMAFGLKLRKYPKAEIEKRVKETATLLGIEDLLNRKPKALSGGQRQRTALGRAIIHNPKVSLYDEPLSNLDAIVRSTTRSELRALHRRLKTTSIYVTHDQSEAMTLGDRICVLYKGEIQQVGSPQEIYDSPTNRLVASFIGILPMNFIEGTIKHNGNNTYFVANGDSLLIPASMKTQLIVSGNKSVVLGMRPEHVTLQPFNGQHQNRLDCLVAEVEPFGDRRNFYLKTAHDNRLIASLAHHSNIPLKQSVRFYIDVEKAHFFEPGEMGKNIGIST